MLIEKKKKVVGSGLFEDGKVPIGRKENEKDQDVREEYLMDQRMWTDGKTSCEQVEIVNVKKPIVFIISD